MRFVVSVRGHEAMNKIIEIAFDEDEKFSVCVTELDNSIPFGAEASGVILSRHDNLDFEEAVERVKEEMVGLLPK